MLIAARNGNVSLVKLLIQAKAQLDQPEHSFQMTPLGIAAFKGHRDIVSLLLQAGADTKHIDKNGLTPLMLAAFHGQGEAVDAFISFGADRQG